MRKLLTLSVLALILCGCGVGVYSVSSGVDDKASLCVIDQQSRTVVVKVDGEAYKVQTVKAKAYKPGRNIKKTAKNSISIPAGKHVVEVRGGKTPGVAKQVFVSTGETCVIEL